MKLPRNHEAIIPERKISDYLLSESHPVGKAKARYFRSLGYSERNSAQLKEAFAAIAVMNEVTEMVTTPFGTNILLMGDWLRPAGPEHECEQYG